MRYGEFKNQMGVMEIDETVEQVYDDYTVMVDYVQSAGRMLPVREIEFDGNNKAVILYV